MRKYAGKNGYQLCRASISLISNSSFKNTSYRYYSLKIDIHGGRSSSSGVVATVFGCTGFVGRSVVNALGRVGSQVVAPFRGEEKSINHLKLMGDLGQIVSVWYSPRSRDSIQHALQNSNVCINLIGSKFPTKNYSLYEANAYLPAAIAECAKEKGIERFIHVSAQGANLTSPSEYLRSKAEGEKLIRDIYPNAIILRPCPLFGIHDRYLNAIAKMFYWWPLVPAVCPQKLVQPMWIEDFSSKIFMNIVSNANAEGNTYEIGGPKVYKNQDIYEFVRKSLMRFKPIVDAPPIVMKALYGIIQNASRVPKFIVEEIEAIQAADRIVDASNKDVKTIVDLGLSNNDLKVLEDISMSFLRTYRPPEYYDFEERIYSTAYTEKTSS